MAFLNAVSRALTGKVVTLHNAGGAAAFAVRGNVDRKHVVEDFDVKFLTDFNAFYRTAEFANETLRFAFSLLRKLDAGSRARGGALALDVGDVTAFTAARETTRLIFETKLHRFVSVALKRLHLKNAARSGLNYGNRDHFSLFGV